MRVLLLNQYYHPDIAATAQLASDLGEALAAHGHTVRAIASARPYAGPGWRPLVEDHRGVHIVRVPGTALGRRTRAGRALDYATYLGGMLAPLLAGPRPDVVIALSTPPLVAALGLVLQRLRGTRLVYWVMDVYPEVAFELGVLTPGSLPARASLALAGALHRGADAIVALDDAMADRLRAAGASSEKIEVIDNWPPFADDLTRVPRATHPLRRELGLGDRFTISYSGNMGLGHDFDTLLDAMTRLRDEDLCWLFIGDGPRRAELERRVAVLGLAHAHFLPYQPLPQLALSLTAADASIVSLEARLAGLLAPSKLYGLLATGVPIVYIGPEEGRTADLVRSHQIGISIRNGDGAGLAASLRRLMADKAELAAMGRRGRALYEERFTRAHSIGRLERLLERVAAC